VGTWGPTTARAPAHLLPRACRRWSLHAATKSPFFIHARVKLVGGTGIGNVHGHRTRARTVRAGTPKPSQLQHATTPPIWTQFELRSKHINCKSQENNYQYKRWPITMVCGDLTCREGWMANQFHEQSTQPTLESSAHNRRMSLYCILRVLLLVNFHSQEPLSEILPLR
jgi:hypothetical protein